MDEFNVQVGDAASTDHIENLKSSFSIYPNPTQDQFTITGNLDKVEISIGSINGTFLRKHSGNGRAVQIYLSTFSTGIHLIRLLNKTDGSFVFKKVVKC